MKYEPLPELDRAEAQRRLETDDLDQLRVTVAALETVEDTDWVAQTLDGYLSHEDYFVAGNAVICLSQLVRTGRLDIADIDRVRARIAGVDREDLKGRVRSALGDIDNYLHYTRGG